MSVIIAACMCGVTLLMTNAALPSFPSSLANSTESMVALMEPSVNLIAITILKLQSNISTLQQLLADLDTIIQNVMLLVLDSLLGSSIPIE